MKKINSLILSLFVLYPSIIGFAHYIFEDHKPCDEIILHFHQLENDCSVCFLLNNTENSFTNFKEFNYNLVSIDELVIDFIDFPKSSNLRSFNLRAPPVV